MKSIANALKGKFKKLFVAGNTCGLILKARSLSNKLNNYGIKNYPIESVKNAIQLLKTVINKQDIGLIFGTHYIAEEVFEEFEIYFDSGII